MAIRPQGHNGKESKGLLLSQRHAGKNLNHYQDSCSDFCLCFFLPLVFFLLLQPDSLTSWAAWSVRVCWFVFILVILAGAPEHWGTLHCQCKSHSRWPVPLAISPRACSPLCTPVRKCLLMSFAQFLVHFLFNC